eukprot:6477655-Amphidinium_carterae.1
MFIVGIIAKLPRCLSTSRTTQKGRFSTIPQACCCITILRFATVSWTSKANRDLDEEETEEVSLILQWAKLANVPQGSQSCSCLDK